MSSRNMRLSEAERNAAVAIYQALDHIRENLKPGSLKELQQQATAQLTGKGFRVDYVAIADAGTLYPAEDWDGRQKLVALAAAFLGEVRLIDNLLLN